MTTPAHNTESRATNYNNPQKLHVMKTKKIGCVNPCAIATLQDNAGHVIGTTLDTPNAIAYAMAVNDKVARAVAHYQFFGDTITTREQLKDRFSWVIKESATHTQFLKWS